MARPWYAKGGMELAQIGMALNVFLPVVFMASYLEERVRNQFLGLLLFSYTASLATGRETVYCILIVPTFMSSLVLSGYLAGGETGNVESSFVLMATALFLSLALSIVKVNVCMSVCYHRFAAHAAFKCGPLTQIGMALLGCLSNQGGPIWWASQHLGHHKHCDVPGDPHSPIISGTEKAFSFFETNLQVWEEFAPKHLDSFLLRVIDTFSTVPVSLELLCAYYWMGRPGLFVAYTSGWICQSVTLWFNVANHPPPSESIASTANDKAKFLAKCNAADNVTMNPWRDPCMKNGGVYLPFFFLNFLMVTFGCFVDERAHEHHHEHPRLAKRSTYDLAYWGFVYPLEQMGLVWNVVVPEGTKKVN